MMGKGKGFRPNFASDTPQNNFWVGDGDDDATLPLSHSPTAHTNSCCFLQDLRFARLLLLV